MDPLQVTIDRDGMVTVTIVDSDGKPATWQLRLQDAEALQAKLFSRLNAFRIEAGDAEKTTPGKLGSRWCHGQAAQPAR